MDVLYSVLLSIFWENRISKFMPWYESLSLFLHTHPQSTLLLSAIHLFRKDTTGDLGNAELRRWPDLYCMFAIVEEEESIP